MPAEFIKRLQERRLNVWEQTKALLDGAKAAKRDLTAEEEQTYTRLSADLDQIDARVKDLVEAEQRAADAEAAFAGLLAKPADARKKPDDTSAQLRAFFTASPGSASSRSARTPPPRTTSGPVQADCGGRREHRPDQLLQPARRAHDRGVGRPADAAANRLR